MPKRQPKPKRDASPTEKAAWLWDQYDREYARLKRAFNRLEKIRKALQRQGKAKGTGT